MYIIYFFKRTSVNEYFGHLKFKKNLTWVFDKSTTSGLILFVDENTIPINLTILW